MMPAGYVLGGETTQERSETAPDALKTAQEIPKTPKRASKTDSDFGAISDPFFGPLGRLWAAPGAVLSRFWAPRWTPKAAQNRRKIDANFAWIS